MASKCLFLIRYFSSSICKKSFNRIFKWKSFLFHKTWGTVRAFQNKFCWPFVETNHTGLNVRSFPVGRQTETGTMKLHYLVISVLLKTCIIFQGQWCSTTTMRIYPLAVPTIACLSIKLFVNFLLSQWVCLTFLS